MSTKNLNNELDSLLSNTILPSDEQIKQDTKSKRISLKVKGIKHSDETKEKWSKAKIGHKRNKDSVNRSINGLKQTWIEKMALVHSKDSIIKAQIVNDNHQINICKELNITINSYKKLLKYYNLEEKKKTQNEKNEWARINQSNAILVWMCSKVNPNKKIGKPKEYYSVSACCNAFEPKLHKANMLNNLKNGTPYRGMIFEYK